MPDFDMAQGYAKEDVYVGRVSYLSVVGEFGPRSFTSVDTTASRFTGASIAGLVVGAMGVFVFTLALRDWLNRRRYFRVQEAEGKT